MRKFRLICLVLGVVLLFGGLSFVEAEDSLFNSSQNAKTDWEQAVVRAKGYGVAGNNIQNKTRARILAREAAISMAERHLLAEIKEMNLNSDKRVRDLESDVVDNELLAAAQEAEVIEGQEPAAGTYMVVIEAEFQGRDGIFAALLSTLKEEVYSNRDKQLELSGSSSQNLEYTGVIIDALNLDLKPALAPKIYDPQERLVYGMSNLTAQRVEESGVVDYSYSLDAAKNNPRSGSNPLVVKAQELKGKTDLILSANDAEQVVQVGEQDDIFKRARVVITVKSSKQ